MYLLHIIQKQIEKGAMLGRNSLANKVKREDKLNWLSFVVDFYLRRSVSKTLDEETCTYAYIQASTQTLHYALVLQDYFELYLISLSLVFAFGFVCIYNPLTIFIFWMLNILRKKRKKLITPCSLHYNNGFVTQSKGLNSWILKGYPKFCPWTKIFVSS